MTVRRKDATHIDAHGVTIHYSVWQAPKPKAVIHLVHGLGEHVLRYEALAQELVAAGYTVWADEHRGHGRTGLAQHDGDRGLMGRLGPGGHRATVAAVRSIGRLLRAGHDGLPLVLLGQSWGSFIAQMLLNEFPDEFDAVVLTGTAHRTPRGMNAGDLNRRHGGRDSTGYEWLSRDPEVVATAAADPLMFKADVLRLFGVADGLRLYGRPRKGLAGVRDVPLLIVVGDDDPLGGPRSAARLAEDYRRRSGLTDVTLVTYPGARHEVFNETNRDEVVADVIGWLDAHVG